MAIVERTVAASFGPNLGDQFMRKPPAPATEDRMPVLPNFSRMAFLKPPMPDFPKEALMGEIGSSPQKTANRPLIEDEDDFEAMITFPDGDFARATSTSTAKETLCSTVDTVGSSWDSASWHRDLPAGTIVAPDRRLHERHVKKMNRFLHDVELAPRTFSGIVRVVTDKPNLAECEVPLNPSMLAGLAAAGAVVVLLPLAFCCICPRNKAGPSKKTLKKKAKSRNNLSDESPAAEDMKAAEEPMLIKKQKKAKASDEEVEAKKAEQARRKEMSKAAVEANKKKQGAAAPKASGAAKKTAEEVVQQKRTGPKLSEQEAKALFEKAQQRRIRRARPLRCRPPGVVVLPPLMTATEGA
ncbi:hypothetical protein AK812_SmicGene15693 [Symbiodinium microadriaticum]|uniref:Uncharacterized protein n=1 Tax=Symbiodinium microadriaticum TaxID=2951 RepID=A0A1Q9E2C6_SYMMI|nr:hypothetical protein AK812_SmicGene15693 [Symbiodinium microadriaticum]